MIKTNIKKDKSVIEINPFKEYFIPSDNSTSFIQSLQSCDDCEMSRISMACYAATKHQYSEKDNKIARMKPKAKPLERKYAETEAPIMLDKYNGKLMNSIWGLYNRNSPHNLKSLNQETPLFVSPPEQGPATFKKATFVQFTVPSFGGIVVAGLETKIEVKKPQTTTLEKLENLFSSPPFF